MVVKVDNGRTIFRDSWLGVFDRQTSLLRRDMDPAFDTQWLFSQSHFQSTPSRNDGLSALQELKARNEGVHFLLRVGNGLQLYVVLSSWNHQGLDWTLTLTHMYMYMYIPITPSKGSRTFCLALPLTFIVST